MPPPTRAGEGGGATLTLSHPFRDFVLKYESRSTMRLEGLAGAVCGVSHEGGVFVTVLYTSVLTCFIDVDAFG